MRKNKKCKDLIYLASPYTHEDKKVMDYRFERVMELTAELIKDGHFVFSPITYCHEMAKKHILPTDCDYWEDFNTTFMSKCKKFIVFKLVGWENSRGVNKEIKIAKKLRIPIEYVEDKK